MAAADILIVGGALVGQSLALALAAADLRVTLIERDDPEAHLAAAFDGRASAIASASVRLLRALGLGPLFDADGCPIMAIRVTDGLAPRHLHFDSADADPPEPLGIMVENRLLRAALLARLRETPAIQLVAPASIAATERTATRATITLADGSSHRAALLIAADGRRSALREAAGIRTAHWAYQGAALVTMIAHERPHGGVASELFYPSGPFAQLPLNDLPATPDAAAVHRSALVWTVHGKDAPAFAALSPRALAHEIERHMGGFLGAVRLIAPVASWPLALHHAERYWAERLILVGDSAHGIHPIAGQGLNMGLRDVAALAQTLADAARTGQDLGHPDVARRYERWRRSDNAATAFATDSLARLFAIPGRPASAIRQLGLATVNRLAPLRRQFMAIARGESGDLPALLRGELP